MSETGKRLIAFLREAGDEETTGLVATIDGLSDAMVNQGKLNAQFAETLVKLTNAIDAMGKENTMLWRRLVALEGGAGALVP